MCYVEGARHATLCSLVAGGDAFELSREHHAEPNSIGNLGIHHSDSHLGATLVNYCALLHFPMQQ
jgi:hypothetical protein